MPTAQDVAWFKSQFQEGVVPALAGTPFSVDMVTAIACQETGPIWSVLRRKGLSTERILELCVGDTIDGTATGGRRAFPKTKAELIAAADGARMFELARQGLVDMAGYIRGFSGAAARPDKFCHGFGIFQLDLQFFHTDPAYFLERHYADFGIAVRRCIRELGAALKRIGWAGKTSLSDHEMAAVAIAYNTGRYNPAKGLKQGHYDGTKFYGENFFGYLQLAHSVQVPAALPTLAEAPGATTRGSRGLAPPATGARKTAVRKTTANKTAANKTAAKRTVAKRTATKAALAKKPRPKTSRAKTPAVRKPTVKKTAPKRPAPKKSAARTARSLST